MADTIRQAISTSHGTIAVEMTQGDGMEVVLIHGNSSCRGVFRNQIHSPLFAPYRLICFDLPGHGKSDDATNKTWTYSRPGLADACVELLDRLHVKSPVLVGWSLGGHVAIEVLSRSSTISGLFIIGAPPVGSEISEGFRGKPLGGLARQGALTDAQISQFVRGVFGSTAEPFMEDALRRVDKEFRPSLFAGADRGDGCNEREVVSSTKVPTAVVNGADDAIINLEYIDRVRYANLWKKQCFRIASAAHAPFLQAPDAFNALLRQFLVELAA